MTVGVLGPQKRGGRGKGEGEGEGEKEESAEKNIELVTVVQERGRRAVHRLWHMTFSARTCVARGHIPASAGGRASGSNTLHAVWLFLSVAAVQSGGRCLGKSGCMDGQRFRNKGTARTSVREKNVLAALGKTESNPTTGNFAQARKNNSRTEYNFCRDKPEEKGRWSGRESCDAAAG